MHFTDSTFHRVLRLITITLTFILLSACGGGGSGSDRITGTAVTPPQQLDGTWSGSLEDPAGLLQTFQITVNGNTLSQLLLDGVDQGLTGTLTAQSTTTYAVSLSDSTKAMFIIDAALQHATFVDDAFNFGVVEKNAIGSPIFSIGDVNGNWSGTTVVTDFATFSGFPSTASCVSLQCTATGNGVTTTIDLTGTFVITFGQWNGSFSNSNGDVGTSVVMLSPDKQFVAAYGCDNIGVFPDACDFSAWVRQ